MCHLLFLISIFVFSILWIFELDCIITHILRSAYQVKIAVQNHCVGQTLWKECLVCALPFRLVCILSTVQTRCCIPQSVSVQAGRPFHCADMDSLSHWYSLLLHLTPSQQGTCTLMYSLYLSVSNQSRRQKANVSQTGLMHVRLSVLVICLTYTSHVQSAAALLTLSPSGPRLSRGAVKVNHWGHARWWGWVINNNGISHKYTNPAIQHVYIYIYIYIYIDR